MDDHAVARAAKVRGDLLGPLEGRVRRPGPAHRHVRFRLRAADLVELRLQPRQPELDAVETGNLVDRAFEPAFPDAPLSPTM